MYHFRKSKEKKEALLELLLSLKLQDVGLNWCGNYLESLAVEASNLEGLI